MFFGRVMRIKALENSVTTGKSSGRRGKDWAMEMLLDRISGSQTVSDGGGTLRQSQSQTVALSDGHRQSETVSDGFRRCHGIKCPIELT